MHRLSTKLPPKCLNLDVVKHSYSHLKNIEFSNINVDSDNSILIGADNRLLHLYMDIHAGSKIEPVTLKTKLGWVVFGGRQNNNKYPNINAFSKEIFSNGIFDRIFDFIFLAFELWFPSFSTNHMVDPSAIQYPLSVFGVSLPIKRPVQSQFQFLK